MKLSRLVIYFLFALLQVNAVFAAPPQRLIIEFDTALNIEQKQTLQQQFTPKSSMCVESCATSAALRNTHAHGPMSSGLCFASSGLR